MLFWNRSMVMKGVEGVQLAWEEWGVEASVLEQEMFMVGVE